MKEESFEFSAKISHRSPGPSITEHSVDSIKSRSVFGKTLYLQSGDFVQPITQAFDVCLVSALLLSNRASFEFLPASFLVLRRDANWNFFVLPRRTLLVVADILLLFRDSRRDGILR